VAYTGTHDNDTSHGWYRTAPGSERDFCRRYLARSGDDIAWDMIRAIWSSAAELTLAPLQDFLSLDSPARMNLPGTTGNNWGWRMPVDVFTNLSLIGRIKETNYLYYRTKGMVKDETVMQGHI
jgi:4-alpha-glucanotransferase